MKVLFYLLITVNLVFFLWEATIGRGGAPETQQALKLPDTGARLQLIEELPNIPRKPVVEAAPVEPEAAPVEAAAATPAPVTAPVKPELPADARSDQGCYLLGPYDSDATAKKALEVLAPELPNTTQVTLAGEKADGYWILFPKAETAETARANRDFLRNKGVVDVWLFDKGPLANAISLGLFKTREKADQAFERFRAKEIPVEVQPRLIKADLPWLRIEFAGERAEIDAILRRLEPEKAAALRNRCE